MSEIKSSDRRVVVFTTYELVQADTIFKKASPFTSFSLYVFFLGRPLQRSEDTMKKYLKALGCDAEIQDDAFKLFYKEQICSFAQNRCVDLSDLKIKEIERFNLKKTIGNRLKTEEDKNDFKQFCEKLNDKGNYLCLRLKDWLSNQTTEQLNYLANNLDDLMLQNLNFRQNNCERRMCFNLFQSNTNDDINGVYALWPLEHNCDDKEEWYDAITDEILSLPENQNCKEIYLVLHNRDIFSKHEYEVLPNPLKQYKGITRKALVFQHTNDKAHSILNQKGSSAEIVESVSHLFPKDKSQVQLVNMGPILELISDGLIECPYNKTIIEENAKILTEQDDQTLKEIGEDALNLIKEYSECLHLKLVQAVGKQISKRYS